MKEIFHAIPNPYDPKDVLHMASQVCLASKQDSYVLDPMASREIVSLVERILADYRHEVRSGDSLTDLLNLLDIFSQAGWPEALQLVWRVDEIFR